MTRFLTYSKNSIITAGSDWKNALCILSTKTTLFLPVLSAGESDGCYVVAGRFAARPGRVDDGVVVHLLLLSCWTNPGHDTRPRLL